MGTILVIILAIITPTHQEYILRQYGYGLLYLCQIITLITYNHLNHFVIKKESSGSNIYFWTHRIARDIYFCDYIFPPKSLLRVIRNIINILLYFTLRIFPLSNAPLILNIYFVILCIITIITYNHLNHFAIKTESRASNIWFVNTLNIQSP
jgi:hypothetical protein